MALKRISDSILYVGADDRTIDLFENQYPVSNGVTYNSYVIKDSKIAVMDTVDERATDQWFDNLEEAFEGKAPDYLERELKSCADMVDMLDMKMFSLNQAIMAVEEEERRREEEKRREREKVERKQEELAGNGPT